MTKDLGVWTAEDSALVLIDYQKEMFEVTRSETNADLVELQRNLRDFRVARSSRCGVCARSRRGPDAGA